MLRMTAAGVAVEHLKFADKAIRGNGQLRFLGLNNLSIIEMLEKWIAAII